MQSLQSVAKALVPVVILVVFGVGYYFKVIPANIWSEVITLGLSALGTYTVKNS